ncbi:MAG: hypothetical protein KF843_06660 [Flavobacteriales bacterium]|nr:hypothetical protein [Flavobacteriales bacterium]
MGRLIKRLLLFGAAVALIYVASMFIMIKVPVMGTPLIFRTGDYYNLPGGHSWQRFHEFDPAKRWDAVIIGSSHAYRGYDPSVFAAHGHHAFNLGSSAQTPLNSYYVIEHYLDSTNCGLLIFDVFEGSLQNTGLESTADLTQNVTSDGAAWGMAWALRDLRGLNMMALRMISRPTEPDYTNSDYVGLGYAVKKDSVGTEAGPPSKKPVELFERQRHFLEACIQLCRDRGIPLVITSHYARSNMRGEAHEVLAQYMDSILTGTSIPYLDYTDTPGIEDRYWFFDHNHLNATGARIFTTELVDTLESLGYLRKP